MHCYVAIETTTPPPQPFYSPFSETVRVSRCQKRTLDFMVQGKINRDRHTDHLAGRHSIRTNQCSHPPSFTYFFTGQMPFLLPNQQHQSIEGSYVAIESGRVFQGFSRWTWLSRFCFGFIPPPEENLSRWVGLDSLGWMSPICTSVEAIATTVSIYQP